MFERLLIAAVVSTLGFVAVPALAQTDAPLTRVVLQKADFPDRYETITARTDVKPGATAPLHTHPGVEMSYVLAGDGDLTVAGQPDRHVTTGDSFSIPAGAVHGVHNTNADKPLTLITTYVVERDKPLATPAAK